jgi:hypothetical protein
VGSMEIMITIGRKNSTVSSISVAGSSTGARC